MSHDKSRQVAIFGMSRIAKAVWLRKAVLVLASGKGQATESCDPGGDFMFGGGSPEECIEAAIEGCCL
jgi:hypothetical protein